MENVDPIRWPSRLALARTPTPVEHLSRLSGEIGLDLYVKRDDLTGAALSGNKVRKLEFLLADARERGARRVYTCGGVQSNHARATAVAAARLGMSSRLYLRGEPPERSEGNVLLDRLSGAELVFVTPDEYREIDARMEEDARAEDPPAYPIPEGGSNALGALGYARAVREIVIEERRSGRPFDAVVHAVGSGGTSAGLVLGRAAYGIEAEVFGVNVCDDEAFFTEKVGRIVGESVDRFAPDLREYVRPVRILDGHVGPGYAMNRPEDFATIRRLARTEGLFLDPVYSGKAMKGLLAELGDRLAGRRRILFIHTGGIFGLFPKGDELL